MAVIQSKVTRSYYKNAALAFIPDLLIAWAVMKYMDGGAETFFFTLIGLQAVYFALWVKRSVWSWLLFMLTNRAAMSSHMENFFVQEDFPKPPDYMSGPDEYFSGITNDEEQDCATRVKAAQELGTLSGITVAQQHQFAMQLRMATEDAIQRYAKRPPSPSKASSRKKPDEIAVSLPKEELDTLAWLADYGFRLVTAHSDSYRRTFDQIPYRQAAGYASLIDKFERNSVPNLLAEHEDDKERRFTSHENRMHTLWTCYPENHQ
jgi:hypothetical protein